jgi:hypothetical protein
MPFAPSSITFTGSHALSFTFHHHQQKSGVLSYKSLGGTEGKVRHVEPKNANGTEGKCTVVYMVYNPTKERLDASKFNSKTISTVSRCHVKRQKAQGQERGRRAS